MNILIVDDDQYQLDLYSKWLASDGHKVTAVDFHAAAVADWTLYGLVIVDMLMPRGPTGCTLILNAINQWGIESLPLMIIYSAISTEQVASMCPDLPKGVLIRQKAVGSLCEQLREFSTLAQQRTL